MADARVTVKIEVNLPVWLVVYQDGAPHTIWFTERMANDMRDQLNDLGGQFRVVPSKVGIR